MTRHQWVGAWRELRGKVREQWGKLTDDDLDVIAGRRDQLIGKLQKVYGMAQDEADRQVMKFEARWLQRVEGAAERMEQRIDAAKERLEDARHSA